MQAPKTYSPQQMAGAQGAATREAVTTGAIVNNVNQRTPFGNVSYQKIGDEVIKDANGNDVLVPRYEQSVELSGAQQQMLDRTNQLGISGLDLANQQIGRLGQTLNTPFTTSGLPAANAPTLDTSRMAMSAAQPDVQVGAARTSVGPSDFSADRRRVEDAILSRIEPQFQRDEAAMRTRLANQGLTPGAEASNADLDTLNRARNDARMQAVLAGGQEQSRMFGQQLQQGQFGNQAVAQNNAAALAQGQFRNASVAQNNAANLTAQQAMNQALGNQYGFNLTGRQNALQEALTLRNQPINEIGALMAGGQVTVPNFQDPYRQTVPATNVGGYMQAQNDARNAAYQNNMSGLFGLGGNLIGQLPGLFALSDRRAKQDITRVGETDEGLPIYRYRYKEGVPGGGGLFTLGVMAQDLEKRKPGAVMTGRDGFKRVDYSQIA